MKAQSDCSHFVLLAEMQLATRRNWIGSRKQHRSYHSCNKKTVFVPSDCSYCLCVKTTSALSATCCCRAAFWRQGLHREPRAGAQPGAAWNWKPRSCKSLAVHYWKSRTSATPKICKSCVSTQNWKKNLFRQKAKCYWNSCRGVGLECCRTVSLALLFQCPFKI